MDGYLFPEFVQSYDPWQYPSPAKKSKSALESSDSSASTGDLSNEIYYRHHDLDHDQYGTEDDGPVVFDAPKMKLAIGFPGLHWSPVASTTTSQPDAVISQQCVTITHSPVSHRDRKAYNASQDYTFSPPQKRSKAGVNYSLGNLDSSFAVYLGDGTSFPKNEAGYHGLALLRQYINLSIEEGKLNKQSHALVASFIVQQLRSRGAWFVYCTWSNDGTHVVTRDLGPAGAAAEVAKILHSHCHVPGISPDQQTAKRDMMSEQQPHQTFSSPMAVTGPSCKPRRRTLLESTTEEKYRARQLAALSPDMIGEAQKLISFTTFAEWRANSGSDTDRSKQEQCEASLRAAAPSPATALSGMVADLTVSSNVPAAGEAPSRCFHDGDHPSAARASSPELGPDSCYIKPDPVASKPLSAKAVPSMTRLASSSSAFEPIKLESLDDADENNFLFPVLDFQVSRASSGCSFNSLVFAPPLFACRSSNDTVST